MAKQITAVFSAVISIDASSDVPLYQQIYESIRHAMLTCRLSSGARLPSTRNLAAEMKVSRNTVMNAFDQLYAEGYIERYTGSGTYVARNLPDELLNARVDAERVARPSRKRHNLLSQRGAVIAATKVYEAARFSHREPFAPGVPALDAFPYETWARLVGRHWRRPQRRLLNYGEPAGYVGLREAIAAYVGTARAVRCTPQQIIIVAGTQQAIDLTARMLLDPKADVWIEEYNYLAARAALLGAGARLIPVPVDDEGLCVSVGAARAPHARLAYVTPSHQYPLGVTMSLARRLQLLEWAEQNGTWILEDDYDSEYRYLDRPLSALQGLDRNGRVIYMGTFSKVLFPALRLGYIVAPPDMVDALVNARAMMGWCSPIIEQAVLADFIAEGHFARHIRRMRALYAERQSTLIEAVRRELGELLEIQTDAAGMHLVGWLPEGLSDQFVTDKAAQYKVEVQPLSMFTMKRTNRQRGGLVLGYGAYDVHEIKTAVHKLALAIRDALKVAVKSSRQ